MRGMSLLQMAGGVAVAGVVAAGTTAFTASAGLTTAGVKAPIFGGTAAVSVNGTNARVTAASFRVATPADPDKVTGVAVTVDDGAGNALDSTNTVVKVTIAGHITGTLTAGGAGAAAPSAVIPCTFSAVKTWNCDDASGSTSNYFDAVTAVNITVVPVL